MCGKLITKGELTPTDKMTASCLIVVNGVQPTIVANDEGSQAAAIQKRLGSGQEHVCQEGVRAYVDQAMEALVPEPLALDDTVITRTEQLAWVTNDYSKFEDVKRVRELIAAIDRCPDPRKVELCVTGFVKDEIYLKPNVKPRLIAACNDEYVVSFAPRYNRTYKVSKQILGFDSSIFYTTGANGRDLGAYVTKALRELGSDVVILENDFSSFEANITVECLKTELDIYLRLGMNALTAQLFKKQFEMDVRSKSGRVRFTREGGRASGVPNTGTGNSWLNALYHFAYFISLGFTPQEVIDAIRMMVLGDDNFTIIGGAIGAHIRNIGFKRFSIEITEWFRLEIGWNSEIKLWNQEDLSKAEYCSGWFGVTDAGNIVWTSKSTRAMLKSFRLKPTDRNHLATMKGVALGYLSGCVDPILEAVCNKVLTFKGVGEQVFAVPKDEWQPQFQTIDDDDCKRINVASCVERYGEDYGLAYGYIVTMLNGWKGIDQPLNLEFSKIKYLLQVDCPDYNVGEWGTDEPTVNLQQRRPNLSAVQQTVPPAAGFPVTQGGKPKKEPKTKQLPAEVVKSEVLAVEVLPANGEISSGPAIVIEQRVVTGTQPCVSSSSCSSKPATEIGTVVDTKPMTKVAAKSKAPLPKKQVAPLRSVTMSGKTFMTRLTDEQLRKNPTGGGKPGPKPKGSVGAQGGAKAGKLA